MLISELRQIIKDEDPYEVGYKWFMKKSKGCKTAIDFFLKM